MAEVPFELSVTAQRLYDALEPVARDEDPKNGYALAHYCAALARLLDEVADLARDRFYEAPEAYGVVEREQPGWSIALDPDETPEGFLPWLAQFVGVRIPDNLPVFDKRARVRQTDGFWRGTPAAIKGALRPFLTGRKSIFLTERHGDPYKLTVTVYQDECPDPTAAEAAVLEQKPAGITLTFSVVPGGDFDTLRDTHSDFDEVASVFTSFDEVREDPAKQAA